MGRSAYTKTRKRQERHIPADLEVSYAFQILREQLLTPLS